MIIVDPKKIFMLHLGACKCFHLSHFHLQSNNPVVVLLATKILTTYAGRGKVRGLASMFNETRYYDGATPRDNIGVIPRLPARRIGMTVVSENTQRYNQAQRLRTIFRTQFVKRKVYFQRNFI